MAADEPKVMSLQGVAVAGQISYKDAHENLSDYDVLVILGGGTDGVLKGKTEPLQLITAFAELQKKDPGRERTLISICTGSLLLAHEGILVGLSATTHPDYLTRFENLCSQAATKFLDERTDVIEDARYVVNNLRFDLGNEDENPYIRRKSDARRPSNARSVCPQPVAPSHYPLAKPSPFPPTAGRAPCRGRAPTRRVRPSSAAPRCVLVASVSSLVAASRLASTLPSTWSVPWYRTTVPTRWPGSCSGRGRRALSSTALTYKASDTPWSTPCIPTPSKADGTRYRPGMLIKCPDIDWKF